jgi:hypothetical protein
MLASAELEQTLLAAMQHAQANRPDAALVLFEAVWFRMQTTCLRSIRLFLY